jgi:hypothetical protein
MPREKNKEKNANLLIKANCQNYTRPLGRSSKNQQSME